MEHMQSCLRSRFGQSRAPADIFVIKLDTKIFNILSHKYSTYLGGSKEERYNFNASVAVNAEGNLIYLTGLTASVAPVDFPIKNALQPLPNCTSSLLRRGLHHEDGHLAATRPCRSDRHSTYLGGPVPKSAQASRWTSTATLMLSGHRRHVPCLLRDVPCTDPESSWRRLVIKARSLRDLHQRPRTGHGAGPRH